MSLGATQVESSLPADRVRPVAHSRTVASVARAVNHGAPSYCSVVLTSETHVYGEQSVGADTEFRAHAFASSGR